MKKFLTIIALLFIATYVAAQVPSQDSIMRYAKEMERIAREYGPDSIMKLVEKQKQQAMDRINNILSQPSSNIPESKTTDITESWTISRSYQAQPGLKGSHWANTVQIAKIGDVYFLIFSLFNNKGYYTVKVNETPFVSFKDIDGNITQLYRKEDYPVITKYLPAYYSANVLMPARYQTTFIYLIPNIDEFLSHIYVKYRVSLGEGYSDIDMNDGSYYKKFNKRLKEAREEIDNRQEQKHNALTNPLEGF